MVLSLEAGHLHLAAEAQDGCSNGAESLLQIGSDE